MGICSTGNKKKNVASEGKQDQERIESMKDVKLNNAMLVTMTKTSFLDNYSIVKELGKGAYGSVYLVTHHGTKMHRAMKKIKKRINLNNDCEDAIRNEIEILKTLDHPNIIKIYESYAAENNFYLITEYLKGDELFDHIKREKRLSEEFAAKVTFQLLSAVFYCHISKIVHRDLKPENILFINKSKAEIKLIDFGTAKVFEEGKKEDFLIGSIYYIAPEVLAHKYDQRCDLWSVGVILYLMLSGKLPFNGKNKEDILESIKQGEYSLEGKEWKSVSEDAKSLISGLLKADVKKRLTAQEALKHSWFEFHKLHEEEIDEEAVQKVLNNLKTYKKGNKLQEAILAFVVHNLPRTEEIKMIYKIYNKIDISGDNHINREELSLALSEMFGLPDAENEAKLIFSNVDSDNSGEIDNSEFIRACIDKKTLFKEDSILKYAFQFFDKDGSFKITMDELKAFFCNDTYEIEENVFDQIIKEFDTDNDGEIDFSEFKVTFRGILDK